MLSFLLFFLFSSNISHADIQKNKIVQDALKTHQKKDGQLEFNILSLFESPNAFKTAIDIFYDRYQKESIEALLVMNTDAMIFASALGFKMNIPIYFIDSKNDFIENKIKEKGRYIIVDDILKSGDDIQSLVKSVELKKAFIMEVCCITEILHLKGREKIQAQVMSIFLSRSTL